MGNPKLLVATDHKPLLKILGDRKLEDVDNPRLLKLKEKTLRWQFQIQHVPGKIHVGPDTLSRKDVAACMVQIFSGTNTDTWDTEELESGLEAEVAANMPQPISWQQVRDAVDKDKVMSMLAHQITEGFPPEKKLLRHELREYYQHRDKLSHVDGVPLYKDRVVVPHALRAAVLETLHSAHQGITGMTLRAQAGVWWPGITPQLKEVRDRCRNCTEHAPSQPSTPPKPLAQPDYPFQCIASDYFQSGGHHYLVIADRFSGWPTVQFCGRSTDTANKLVECLREYFSMHGIPEELSSDGGSTYMAYESQKFLADYGVKHRVSSVAYPHSNQRAELAVKSMKRLIRENTGADGSLNNDKFLRAVMMYRNTPDRDTERSPAQVIFGRNLRDFLPAPLCRYKPQPQWVLQRDDRERALRKRALRNMEQLSLGTKTRPPLQVHDTVQVQNQVGNHPSRWDITGTVVEVKEHDQYVVKVHGSGRLTTRNRKFLKKIEPYCSDIPQYTSDPVEVPDLAPASNIRLDEASIHNDEALSGLPQPAVEPHDAGAVPALPGQLDDSVEQQPRRSSRARQVPDRLNIETTKCQSYKSAVNNTASMSVSVSTTSFHSGLVGGKASLMLEDYCLSSKLVLA